MKIRTRALLALLLFAVRDSVIPIPIVASILVYALLARPSWFVELDQHIYAPELGARRDSAREY